MKDYKDLFYYKRQLELVEKAMQDVGRIQNLFVFDEEMDMESLDKVFKSLYQKYQVLKQELEDEKEFFTKEELKELHWKYKEMYHD